MSDGISADMQQWSFGEGTPGKGVPVVIRIAQRTTITDEGKQQRAFPLLGAFPLLAINKMTTDMQLV
jgi:hypothetical protein